MNEELIRRLENATAPDATIDGDIHALFGRGHVLEANEAEAWFVKQVPSAQRQTRHPVPRYMSSAEAAITLLPHGRIETGHPALDTWCWSIEGGGRKTRVRVWIGDGPLDAYDDTLFGVTVESDRQAVAICIAAIHALTA